MKLWSNSFEDEKMIPKKYTKGGDDISPHLAWDEIPDETKSFALIVDDPDAPGGNWIHWIVYDIPSEIREIKENSVPKNSKQLNNDFGISKYGGPAPPSGTHRYIFKLYALDVLELKDINKRNIYDKVEKHKIEKAKLMGKYMR